MVLVCQWCPNQSHQAVARQPADGPLVAVDGVHHHLDDPIQERLGLFCVSTLDQLS